MMCLRRIIAIGGWPGDYNDETNRVLAAPADCRPIAVWFEGSEASRGQSKHVLFLLGEIQTISTRINGRG